jgi:hypothetical protein
MIEWAAATIGRHLAALASVQLLAGAVGASVQIASAAAPSTLQFAGLV